MNIVGSASHLSVRRIAHRIRFTALAAALIALPACQDASMPTESREVQSGGGSGGGHEDPVASVVVTPSAVTLNAIGGTARLSVEVGASQADEATSWKSENEQVATVDAEGRVIARGVGTALVVAAVAGAADTAHVEVRQVPATVSIGSGTAVLAPGDTVRLLAEARDSNGVALTDGAVEWAATAPSVARVGEEGLVRALAIGSTTVRASAGGVTAEIAVQVEHRRTGTEPSTWIYPGEDIQARVNAHPVGTSFTIKSGVHRLQTIKPKRGNAFIGEPGAVLSGAKLLTSFKRSGAVWVASGQTQQGPRSAYGTVPTGACSGDSPRCFYPEDLFINDVAQKHVASASAVRPGTWYFDYATDRIYVGTDPTGRRVETSVTTKAFDAQYGVNDVVVRGLAIEKFANPAQAGAVSANNTNGWLIENNDVRWNHGIGIFISNGTGHRVVRNKVHHNGQLGMGSYGTDGLLVEGNEIAHNNVVGYNSSWEAGATKFARTTGIIIRGNNVHDNRGKGLWTDIDNRRVLMEGNTVRGNTDYGIHHEISYDAVIRDNLVENNGWEGIVVTRSPGVEVSGNTVRGNRNPQIVGRQDVVGPVGKYGPLVMRDFYVHHNKVNGGVGVVLGGRVKDLTFFKGRNNRFDRNEYDLRGAPAAPFAWQGGTRTEAQWRAYGMDANGTFKR
jgi:parallel beta-helix repeat protein